MGKERCDYCKGSALVTVVRFCPSCEEGRRRQAALPSTKAADAALSLLTEARAVLDQAIWRLEIVSQEVDSTFCRDALTGLRGLRATLDAATPEEGA